jgi:16S rRNA (cytosine1402-N4)-methyltransferase
MYHNPVMPDAVLAGLLVQPGGTYVDATFGGGGHAKAILNQLGNGRLIAFDQDDDAQRNLPDDPRLLFVNHNFRFMKNFLRWHNCIPVDGILADLGVSSHQIDASERGFSTRFEGPLDMRMNQNAQNTAAEVLNSYPADKLADLFFFYGELRNARRIASTIEASRNIRAFETTGQLVELLRPLAPGGKEMKFLAKVFQALRIEVNSELEALKAFLEQCTDVLKPGGRLVVIAYHSLEDRLVKNFIKAGNFEGKIEKDLYGNFSTPFRQVSKAIFAAEKEIMENKRARSARLRIAQKN